MKPVFALTCRALVTAGLGHMVPAIRVPGSLGLRGVGMIAERTSFVVTRAKLKATEG